MPKQILIREYGIAAGYQTEMVDMPVGAEIIGVCKRAGDVRVSIVARVDTSVEKTVLRKFKCLKANQACENHQAHFHYLGSVDVAGVLNHVHEVILKKEDKSADDGSENESIASDPAASDSSAGDSKTTDVKTETKVETDTDLSDDLDLDSTDDKTKTETTKTETETKTESKTESKAKK